MRTKTGKFTKGPWRVTSVDGGWDSGAEVRETYLTKEYAHNAVFSALARPSATAAFVESRTVSPWKPYAGPPVEVGG